MPLPSAAPRVSLPLQFAGAHWAFLVLAQCENFFRGRPGVVPLESLHFLLTLPLLQAENAAAALIVALLAASAARKTLARLLFFIGYAILTLDVAIDPTYFGLFADHFRLSLAEGARTVDPTLGLSSLWHAGGLRLGVNLALTALLLVWLGRLWLGRQPHTPFTHRRAVVFLAAIAFLLDLWPTPATLANLRHHPLFPLLQEAALPKLTAGLASHSSPDDVPLNASPSISVSLAEAGNRIRAAAPHPNVLLIVLESVGARQLLTANGLPDETNTPNLAALAHSAAVFDQFYCVFPGTVRSHLALNTGGQHLTWNSVYDLLTYPYEGPLLAKTFGDLGYATALFSSERLDGEAMDEFEQRAHYGKVYDYARDLRNHVRGKALNSWGSREELTTDLIAPWLDEAVAAGKPVLLSYMNVATHHPYSVPPGFPTPNGADSDLARYRNALHYSDATIGRLLALFQARGLLAHTVVVVTGDHGEAFGDLHPGNLTHRNYVYDENIRSFLLLSHPAIGSTIHESRLAYMGDVFPTLAALSGAPSPSAPGRDLFSRELPARAFFFSKAAYPEQWGVRDGRWKFIESIRSRQYELYDLEADPTEQHNVAAAHAGWLPRFSRRCENWFLERDAEFCARLAGYHPPVAGALPPGAVRSAGPKLISIGYAPDDENAPFEENAQIDSNHVPAIQTIWVPYQTDQTFTCVWLSPSRQRYTSDLRVIPNQYRSRTPYPGPTPLEPGPWHVMIEESSRPLLTRQFSVGAYQ